MTQAQDNFSLIRRILIALGLSHEAVDDIIDRIVDFLSDSKEKDAQIEYPYLVRDDFLTPAEQNFFLVLKSAVSDWALACPKVALGDLFYAKSDDPSKFRSYRNRIDRKHVDFLLCDPQTARPLLGIELDDKSHQQRDRQDRDEFVKGVFSAARLPLVRIPVQQSYSVAALTELLRARIGARDSTAIIESPVGTVVASTPVCPKCGSAMILRTAKTGANRGHQFWGCSKFPDCRGIVQYEPANKDQDN